MFEGLTGFFGHEISDLLVQNWLICSLLGSVSLLSSTLSLWSLQYHHSVWARGWLDIHQFDGSCK